MSRSATACALIAGALVLLAGAGPAFGWGDDGHFLITEEAVLRLPQPLRGLLAETGGEEAVLRLPQPLRGLLAETGGVERLKEASVAPDRWTADERAAHADDDPYTPVEMPKHFFDIDILGDEEPFPFANFPRTREAARERLGKERFAKLGTGPWAVQDTLGALVAAMGEGRSGETFRQAGALAHFAADLHMPFHTTANYDGKLSGNPGIHKALEIGLVRRYLPEYRERIREGRRPMRFLEKPEEAVFGWIVEAHARVAPVLEADTIAREATGYNPKEHEKAEGGMASDLDRVDAPEARPYYARLQEELEKRGSPEAAAMREAAAHVADLLYTAWVRAGKPVALVPPPKQEESNLTWYLVAAAVAMTLLLLWPRRRPEPSEPPS